MQINAKEFLTKAQKDELGEAYFNKLLQAIDAIEFSKTPKVNISRLLQSEIEGIFDNDFVYENMDTNKIGKVITDMVVSAIKQQS